MVAGDKIQTAATTPLNRPCNRKCCSSCLKFVYLHQPILCCENCAKVFHGKCLNFNNDVVFNLQQTSWFCNECSNFENRLNCHCCNSHIIPPSDKFAICNNCNLPAHTESCMFHKSCLQCVPDFIPSDSTHDTLSDTSHMSNFTDYRLPELPYFTPFNTIENDHIHLIEPDQFFDKYIENNRILKTCEYYSDHKFNELCSSFSSNTFSIISLNIDGFKANFDKFRIFNQSINHKISCFALCESNVTQADSQHFYLDGYNKFVQDKIKIHETERFKQKGSGLVLYLDTIYNDASIATSFSTCTVDAEILTVRFTSKTHTHYILTVYRPPRSTRESVNKFIEILGSIVQQINEQHKNHKIHIAGDFNLNVLNPSSDYVSQYLDCIFSNGLFPIISRPTHFMGRNPTCIDHILTNQINDVISSGVIMYNISHHMPTFSINSVDDISDDSMLNTRPRLCINERTIQGFLKDFKQMTCVELNDDKLNTENAQICFDTFLSNFKKIYDTWFLHTRNKKCKNVHLKSDWITIGLAKSCEVKNKLYISWHKNRTKHNWNTYIIYKRKLDKLLAKAKYDYFNKEFTDCKSDLKKTWNTINKILGRKRRSQLLTFKNDDAPHNFNTYFTSVAHNLIDKTYPHSNTNDDSYKQYLKPSLHTMDTDPFQVIHLKEFISKLNNNKSTYFSPRVLKSIVNDISPLLMKLYNKCFSEGYFPDELKIAKVIPLYKNKGMIDNIGNYRPISMLSVFSKLFEKLIHKNLSEYFYDNDILTKSQYGFRAGHSTLHALINATDNLYKSIDKNMHTLGIFIDFSKAFDTINHKILCSKLEHYGVQGNMLSLISNYLSNRHQYVQYGGNDSTRLPILHGVPQGSVLGPLLFTLFINDIVNASNQSLFVLFADDANVFVNHIHRNSLFTLSNRILSEIYKYCCANKLIINYDKCCFIEFNCKDTSSNSDFELYILNEKVKRVHSCKFLGVYINSSLNWNDHLSHVKSQVSKAIGSLYHLKSTVPQKILRSIYYALVQPYLLYALPLWGSNHSCKLFKDIFILQKKALRIITNRTNKIHKMFQHTKQLFKKTNILTIHNLYYYLTASECKRILDNGFPVKIFDMFTVSPRSHRLLLPMFKKEHCKKNSFIFNASKITNYFLNNNLSFKDYTQITYKVLLKRHLITCQSMSHDNSLNWLPCNLSIFSEIRF